MTTEHTGLLPLPTPAADCLSLLEGAGHEAWLDGGFVRNCLAGRRPGHITVATDALPERIQQLFDDAGLEAYVSDKRILSVTLRSQAWPHSIQVSTFHRVLEHAEDGSPLRFEPAPSIQEDLARRDFTFNAIAFHPRHGLVDPYRGARDIRRQTIRFVGNPEVRLAAEPLCALRALRFASTMGFSIDPETHAALDQAASRIASLDMPQARHQLEKFLCGSFAHDAIMGHLDFLGGILPELLPMRNFDQMSRFHCYDVLEHTAWVVQNSKAHPLNRWAALLHDSGKPECFVLDNKGRGHMPGHPEVSLSHLATVAQRFRFPDEFTNKLKLLIRHHDDRPAATGADVKRLYEHLGCDAELFRAECDLMRADSLSKAEWCQMERILITNDVEELFERMLAEGKL